MSKINETNYPRRPQSDYEDTDMLIIQEAGGNTYTTRIEDIREDCQETIAPTVEAVNDALAPPENGSTASQSYAIGEHFMRNGDFCTAIAAITSGASFTLNTNYVVGTIAEALESLTSDLAYKTGDVLTVDSATTGYLIGYGYANLAKQITLTIPLSKIVRANGFTFSCNSVVVYYPFDASTKAKTFTISSAESAKINVNGLQIALNSATAESWSLGAPVTVYITSATITFT